MRGIILMAVVLQQPEEDKKEEGQEQGQPLTLSQGPQGGAGGGASGGSQPTSRQRKGSGRFTNLQRYIDANQGAAARTGQQIQRVAQNVQKRAEPEEQQRLADIRSQIDAERQRLGQAGQFAQTVQEGTTDQLSQLATDQADQFAQLRTGQTALPQLQEIGNQTLGQVGQTADQLQNIADQSRTEQGRFGLLRQAIGGPRYSAGQRRLDQLILQGAGTGALRDLQQGLSQEAQAEQQQLAALGQEFDTGFQDIDTQALTAQEQLQAALGRFGEQAGFGEAGSGELGELYSALESQRESERVRQDQEFNRLRSNIQAGDFGKAELELLGVNPDQRIFNVDLSKYGGQVKRGDTNVSQADVIQEEQQRRLDALTRLAGLGEASQAVNLGEKRNTPGVVFENQKAVMDEITASQKAFDDFLAANHAKRRTRTHKGNWLTGKQKKSHGYASATGQQLLDMLEGRSGDQIVLNDAGGHAGKQARQAADDLRNWFAQELQKRGYHNKAMNQMSTMPVGPAVPIGGTATIMPVGTPVKLG